MTIHHKIGLSLIAGTFACLAMALWTAGAFAEVGLQMTCGVHDDVVGVLFKKFKETRRAIGIINDAAFIELFVSPKETWTLVVTISGQGACVMAGGTDWETEKPTTGAPL